MKKIIIVIIGVMLLLPICIFSGCITDSIENRFVGTWKSFKNPRSYSFITFRKDGTFIEAVFEKNELSRSYEGTWKLLDDAQIKLTPSEPDSIGIIYSYEFSGSLGDKTYCLKLSDISYWYDVRMW